MKSTLGGEEMKPRSPRGRRKIGGTRTIERVFTFEREQLRGKYRFEVEQKNVKNLEMREFTNSQRGDERKELSAPFALINLFHFCSGKD